MCKAAHETANGLPCRCARPDGQFTRREADQRTRSRAMNAMSDNLNNGDVAVATRAASRAVSAQERLDLMADPDALPHIDMFINKSETARVEKAIADFKQANPDSNIRYEIGEHVAVREGNASLANRWTKVTIYEGDAATLPNRLMVPRDLNTKPEAALSTYEVLGRGLTAIDESGFVKKGETGATAEVILNGMREAQATGKPSGGISRKAMGNMILAREHLMLMDAKTDFEKRVKEVAQKDFIAPEDVGTLAAGANLYKQHVERESRAADAAAAASARKEHAPNPDGNWIGNPGLWSTALARIDRVAPVAYEGQHPVRWVVNMKTENGDNLKVFSSVAPGQPGDWLTISGPVEEHSSFNGAKETVFGDSRWEGNGKASWEFI